YETLSYTWGNPAPTHQILLCGHPFPISQNLYTALLHLASSSGPRIFWIDAVCINQLDLAEKAKQVEIMFDIYRASSRVVVWLGEATE
ncbi:heterokaryon incompatibility, partial [Sporormia fimetaria CBS 119925]